MDEQNLLNQQQTQQPYVVSGNGADYAAGHPRRAAEPVPCAVQFHDSGSASPESPRGRR